MSSDEGKNLSVLSDLILQDPAMTLHVLRAANSSYRVRRGKINTVSRAIVMLGFDTVRDICLSCALLDGIMVEEPKEELVNEMARSFHAATQARYLALNRGAMRTEETFTLALLRNFGAMVFWAYGGKHAEELDEALKKDPSANREELEQRVLGFTLEEFSDAVAESWGFELTSSLEESADPGVQKQLKEIDLCHSLSKAAHQGWSSEGVSTIIDEIASVSGIPMQPLQSMLQVAAKEAASTASSFGADRASSVIPVPNFGDEEMDEQQPIEVEEFEVLEADPLVQLQALQDISSIMEARGDVTLLMSTTLEAMRHGLGLDRVVFAMTNDRRDKLTAKLVLGADQKQLLQEFVFDIPRTDSSLFFQVFENNKSYWMSSTREAMVAGFDIDPLMEVVGDTPFFLGPIVVDQKPIGVFYGDMKKTERELDRKLFQSFKQLVLQNAVAIRHIEDS